LHFLLIHGTGGSPIEAFYPWLRVELEERGYEVKAPWFPTPIGQTLPNWLKVARKHYGLFDEDLVIVGRSVGAAFIPSLLEDAKPKKPIKAAFLVAGFCSSLHLPAFNEVLSTFVDKKFNWPLIKKSANQFFVYNSHDDPLVPFKNGEELARNLGTELSAFRREQHFWGLKFQPILADILSLK
jgi:uncharacterized protein